MPINEVHGSILQNQSQSCTLELLPPYRSKHPLLKQGFMSDKM